MSNVNKWSLGLDLMPVKTLHFRGLNQLLTRTQTDWPNLTYREVKLVHMNKIAFNITHLVYISV